MPKKCFMTKNVKKSHSDVRLFQTWSIVQSLLPSLHKSTTIPDKVKHVL